MSEPSEEIIKREIARAREILRSDRHSAELKGMRERFDKHFPDTGPADDGKPKPPPPVDPQEPPKKRGIWFGDQGG